MSSNVVHIEEYDDFQIQLAKAKKGQLIIVDCFASWCGPCKMIAPFFDSLSVTYPNVMFIKAIEGEVTQALNVRAYPTFFAFKDQQLIDQMKGADQSGLENLVLKNMDDGEIKSKFGFDSPYKHFPLHAFLKFEQTNFDKVLAKLLQFNEEFALDESNSSISLNDEDVSIVRNIVQTLKDTKFYHSSDFDREDYRVMDKLLTQWPDKKKFPVLDILRMMALHPKASSTFADAFENDESIDHDFVTNILAIINTVNQDDQDFVGPTVMMAIRFIVNGFSKVPLKNLYDHPLRTLTNPPRF
eukprot:TRINITY_DN1195_c0_g1_i4.p1 TRINITY_DN1195_c0_g1~~TRINITY_DN1195_c0_g1_i4.p1  ORF type:complete len:308 (+),score=93.10 TRINITY_DN1195_c0_g1_i4:28-924(+)